MAGLVRGVEDLIIEDGEVEGKAKTNWVGWCKISLGNFGGVLVGLKGLVCGSCSLVADRELSEIAVVVALPVIMYQLLSTAYLRH